MDKSQVPPEAVTVMKTGECLKWDPRRHNTKGLLLVSPVLPYQKH